MFKSVFTKYITTFFIIIALCFMCFTLMVSSKITSYSIEAKQTSMQNTAENAVQYIFSFIKSSGTDFRSVVDNYPSDIGQMLERNAAASESIIFITDTSGNVLLSSDKEDLAKSLSKGTLENILQDSKAYQYSDLDGFFTEKHLNYIYSMRDEFQSANGSEIGGFIFISSYSDRMEGFVNEMTEAILLSVLIVFIIALVSVYLISAQIIKPLKAMSSAAKSFAQGKFDTRVPVRGHDEVAELAIAFNNMAGELSRQEEMNRTFLGNVSHDLRTPMTTIAGFIDGILDGAIPQEKQSYYLQIIASEVRRLSRLVTSLLDISRLQSDERKFVKAPFDIPELARQVLISFESKIDAKKLRVEFNCPYDKKLMALADEDSIHQVMYNLCENAVKFSKEGGMLSISISEKDSKIFCSVKNEGIGIQADDLPFVFDRFYKSDRSRGLDKTGVGLGLFIVKSIIDKHGEEIWVNSVYGEYCEFVFTLQKATDSAIHEELKIQKQNMKKALQESEKKDNSSK